MYSSIFINLIMAIVVRVQTLYRYSLTHSIIQRVKRVLALSFDYSIFKWFFNKLEYIYDNSLCSKVSYWLGEIFDRVFSKMYKSYNKSKENISTFRSLDSYTRDGNSFIWFLSMLLIFGGCLSGIFIVLGYLVIPHFVPVLILGIGVILNFFNNVIIDVINGSTVVSFIKNLYKLDRGGENWW